MLRLAVIGAGSYGTAMAIQLARGGTPTQLWGRNGADLETMQRSRSNARYLPGCPFPDALAASADLGAVVSHADHLVVVVPSQALRETLARVAPLLRGDQGIACACKGFEAGTGRLVHQVFAEVLGDQRRLAVISGPTFAKEMGRGLPTAVTVASGDEAFASLIAHALHGDRFRAYTSDDVIGVEVGGSAKNVMAIAVGIADGLGLGANTRAALITRGLAEIMRLGEALGARTETLIGLAGMGDLVLTCTDNQSRNRRFGLLLAQGRSVAEAIHDIQQVVEGVTAAPEVLRLARLHGVEMPITEQVVRVIDGEITPAEAVSKLASRPVKPESA
ncbi:MAG: NAD(P)H-dependent glycerol-3-phosphate dehydrogenase [Panacagrimonas sp.]